MDVLLSQMPDGGEIEVRRGRVTMRPGLENAVYLSLFGGNVRDDGRDENTHNWWGNVVESRPERRIRSETQYLLNTLSAIPRNLRRIEDAIRRDLEWMVESDLATELEVSAVITAPKRIAIVARVDGDTTLAFEKTWESSL